MKVLVADKFEQSGIDGLKAAGCEVVYEPDLKDDALREAIADDAAPTCWSCAARRSPTPMLDAGRLSLIVRAGAGYNTIDVAGGVDARHLRLELSRQERDRRRRAGVRADPGARSPRPRQRRRAARRARGTRRSTRRRSGLYGRTLGLLGVGSIGQEMIRRAAGFGMPSCSGAAASTGSSGR